MKQILFVLFFPEFKKKNPSGSQVFHKKKKYMHVKTSIYFMWFFSLFNIL